MSDYLFVLWDFLDSYNQSVTHTTGTGFDLQWNLDLLVKIALLYNSRFKPINLDGIYSTYYALLYNFFGLLCAVSH